MRLTTTKKKEPELFDGLENIDENKYFIKVQENEPTTWQCVADKLGQLEDIEEELGIDLVTLIKAFTQGFIYMDIKENNKGVSEIIKFEVGGILFDKKDKVWRLTNDDRYDGAYW